MRFPSITYYIESVENIADRLRTRKNIKPLFDKDGNLLYYASKGVVSFLVEVDGKVLTMKCFTSIGGYDRVNSYFKADIVHGEMLDLELFVFDDNQAGDYYTIFIEDRFSEVKSEYENYVYPEGLIPFESDGLWGYKSVEGRVVINAMYDSVDEFSEGRAVVVRNGLHGLTDTNGHLVLNTVFDEISWDGSAIAYCDRGGHWGCYDRSGRMIVACEYDWIGEFSNSLLLVNKKGKYGYVDLFGAIVIPLIYDSATSFDENGLASVKTSGKSFVINTQGKIDKE